MGLPPSGSVVGKDRIPAHDQTLARIARILDLGGVYLL